jgi:hypothetical protein
MSCRLLNEELLPSAATYFTAVRRVVNEAMRPRRGMSGRDEAGRGATRQAGIGRALPTGLSGRDEVGRGPPGPRLVRDPRPVHSSGCAIMHCKQLATAYFAMAKTNPRLE